MIFLKVPGQDNLLGFKKELILEIPPCKLYSLHHQDGTRLMKHHLDPDLLKPDLLDIEALVKDIQSKIDSDFLESLDRSNKFEDISRYGLKVTV